MPLLDDLNPRQREAVLASDGPVLVLAGAGTGKTRVITYRIAYLMELGVPGESILAVTFTNKAADQMKERVSRLAARGGRAMGEPWVSTFHSFCARMLRREAPRLELRRDFAIYDEDDQAVALKLALGRIGYEESRYAARGILERISFAKNHGITPEQMAEQAKDDRSKDLAKIFAAYEETLKRAGALDFDDLLLRAVEVLRRFDEARAQWNRRFKYALVDEYQDTNRVQYELLRLLTGERRNLCVVGDEDQSIYSWRGADVGNVLRFAEDFPGAQVIRLEENYRSTQKILDAAAGVVSKNVKRLGKSLTATRGEGSALRFYEARDAAAEAEYIASEVFQLERNDPGTHIAVLYRMNSQSRALEEALRRAGTRYRMLGGFSFYQRAEIKDALAYARLAINPEDDVALLRVLNTPPRGIGKAVDALQAMAKQRGVSLWSAIGATVETGGAGRAIAPLKSFRELIEGLSELVTTEQPAEFLNTMLDRTGYMDYAEQQDMSQETGRAENLRELVNAVAEGAEHGESLSEFLERSALASDADNYDEEASVTLLTLHSAKGLEFEHVFLTGMEEGVFPHSRSMNGADELEEERRLCYVGMTRAKDSLTLTRAVYRRVYGKERLEGSLPSRFLAEIPGELIETAKGSLADAGETRRYEPDPEYSYTPEEFSRRVRQGTFVPKPTRAPARARATSRTTRGGPRDPLIGTRVRHPSYGVGTIIEVDGEGEERKLTVSFSDHGTKKLLERFAKLVPA